MDGRLTAENKIVFTFKLRSKVFNGDAHPIILKSFSCTSLHELLLTESKPQQFLLFKKK